MATDAPRPFYISAVVRNAWKLLAAGIMACDPVLLVGSDGCGKSECVRALACLLGAHLRELSITPGAWRLLNSARC